MKKVYCIIFDYDGYENEVEEIHEKEKDAIERLLTRSHECGYDNIPDFMRDNGLSLVEWECGSNTQRLIRPSYDW